MSAVDEGVRRVPSACPLDCPDACSLDVTVEDGRVVAVGGSHRQPRHRGLHLREGPPVSGARVRASRLLHPGMRNGPKGAGEFRPVSWDEALDVVARRLVGVRDRRGGEAILPFSYGGSNG